MNKLLFVSPLNEALYSGGTICSRRNYESLQEILTRENIFFYRLTPIEDKSRLKKIVGRLRSIVGGYMLGLNYKRKDEILSVIKENDISIVFLDSSLLGKLAREIKKIYPHIKIISFFHNSEYHFAKQQILVNRTYLRFFWIPLAYLNDKYACKYSDKVVALNKNDADKIKKLYNRNVDRLIPISLKDDRGIVGNHNFSNSNNKKLLFIGSWFFANIQGIKWFLNGVLPHVNVDLVIVGNGMNNLKNELLLPKNVSLFDNVSDLAPYYEEADAIVMPIFSGNGMKVKTAEALMYGKYILATEEALQGYAIDDSIGLCCETEEDFIRAINNFPYETKFHPTSRALFDKRYSYSATLSMFNDLLNTL